MKIAICGSMAFAKEMLNAKKGLEKLEHKTTIQEDENSYVSGKIKEEEKFKLTPLKNILEK